MMCIYVLAQFLSFSNLHSIDLPPEKDPIFLSLLGIIFMLTFLAILFGLVMCCKALNQKLSPTMHYSLKLNEAENESVTFPNTPCMWTKLSGRSCKMARNSTKLHVLQDSEKRNKGNTSFMV